MGAIPSGVALTSVSMGVSMSNEIASVRVADLKHVGRGYYIAGHWLLKLVGNHVKVVGEGYGHV